MTDQKIKRDPNTNKLDHDDADQLLKKITKDLITTQRDHQKEISFKHAMTNRRDILVKVILYQKNTVNGMIVKDDSSDPLFEKLSADPLDPYRYKYFDHLDGEISAKEQPMRSAVVGRWVMGMFKATVNYLARMNVMDRI